MKKDIIYKLSKLKDTKFKGNHPNMIFAGMEWVGRIKNKPKVGESFHLGTIKDHPRNHLYTSVVTNVISGGIFYTLNSKYKLKKL